jgi:hypothetical protein
MLPTGIWSFVDFVRTYVSEEFIASIFVVEKSNRRVTLEIEECRLLGCYAIWLLQEPMFRRNPVPPSTG